VAITAELRREGVVFPRTKSAEDFFRLHDFSLFFLSVRPRFGLLALPDMRSLASVLLNISGGNDDLR